MRPAATPETSSDISRGLADAATRPLQELLSLPHSSERGLSARDAASILETTGPNRIAPAPRKTVLADLLDRLGNPLALVLLFAATVSGFTGDASSFVIISAVVAMSVVLDVTQERHAQNAAERLRAEVSLSAKARRDARTKPAAVGAGASVHEGREKRGPLARPPTTVSAFEISL